MKPESVQNADRSAGNVFIAFLKLGLTSFGGPVAHLGYFRDAFVTRRKWLTEETFAAIVSLCQLLPGPSSSQVGFAIGLKRAGWLGGLAAFTAFTMPSAILMFAFALGADWLSPGAIHGLKLAAVAIVAQAVLGMARALTPDAPRAAIAVAGIGLLAIWPGIGGMVAAIALGAAAGMVLCKATRSAPSSFPISGAQILMATAVLVVIALVTWLIWPEAGGIARAGALVFGGGHVVLPLLETELVSTGLITQDTFLAGYGAAQAVPGPLFSIGAFLGATITPESPALGAVAALIAIFLPGFLLLIAALPVWSALSSRPAASRAIAGANAAVVGVLAMALYDPVMTHAVQDRIDFAVAIAGFAALVYHLPPWCVVLICAALGAIV